MPIGPDKVFRTERWPVKTCAERLAGQAQDLNVLVVGVFRRRTDGGGMKWILLATTTPNLPSMRRSAVVSCTVWPSR